MPDIDKNSKQYLNKILGAAKIERSSFIPHYRALSTAVQPNKGQFIVSRRNRGAQRWQEIINNIATKALRVATAGMFAGNMNPARPWFTWDPPDPDMKQFEPVKIWLDKVDKLMFRIFNESNLYEQAPQFFREAILFGTAVQHHDDDFEDVARFYTHTVGQYMLAQDSRQVVDTMIREFEMTTEQIVGRWGLDNVSRGVKTAWDASSYHVWHQVNHIIRPNPDADPGKQASRFKPFQSIYWEPGSDGFGTDDKKLAVKGYDEFPAYAMRWDITGNEVYGTDCPGMSALGDTNQLQSQERAKGQAIQKQVNPPLTGPAGLKNVSALPGGLTKYRGDGSGNELRPVYEVSPQLADMRADMDAVEGRIREDFHNDLFQAITRQEGIQPRNQLELSQRDEERLLQLGPVLQRAQRDYLHRLANRTFNQAVRAGIVPPAPEELQGISLLPRFISSLAIAQRVVDRQEIEQVVGFAAQVASIPGKEDAADKIDADQAIDLYAEAIGAPPGVIVPDELVSQRRQSRAEQQADQNQAELANQAAQTAKLERDASQ